MATKVGKGYEKSLTPASVLVDDLKSEELSRRINSVKNLNVIAAALGPDRTKSELIPFLSELYDDEDEVLICIAEAIPTLIDLIGGPSSYYVLLEPLEKLMQVEEPAIRDKATQSLKQLLTTVDFKKNDEPLISLVRKLVSSESQLPKVEAAKVIPAIYPHCTITYQNELLKTFGSLAADDTPFLRKAASASLKDFIKLMPNINENEIIGFFKNFLKEDQDFVKMQLIDSILALEQAYANNTQKLSSVVVPFIKTIAEDQAWRVRYTFSDKIVELGQYIGKELNKKAVLPHFVKLLGDSQTEIRANAAYKLAAYAALLDAEDIVGKIIPAIKPLSTDSEQAVRAALASSLLQLCPLVGKKYTNDQLLSIFLLLLRDEYPEARVNLMKHLDEMTKVIDIDSLSQSLFPALNELASDKNWRTRASCTDLFPFFARKMGEDFLNEKFSKILLDWLSDQIFGVRDAAVKCVRSLTEILGGSWAERVLIPKISTLQHSPSYLHRQTLLFVIMKIVEFFSHEALAKTIIPILVTLYKDSVPNVRMNTAKTLKLIFSALKDKSTEKENVKKMLAQLADDPDPDVSYQAKA